MKKMFLLFSHELTEAQVSDAKNLGVEEFVHLPDNLQKIWSNVPPEIEDLDDLLAPIKLWINKQSSAEDYVLIQGDFGAVVNMVDYCDFLLMTSVYATTKREFTETKKDNKIIKTSVFTHVRFREY